MTDVLVACVAENRPGFFEMAQNLVLSVREHGGALADAPVVVNFVDAVEPEYAQALKELDAEPRVVERVPGGNPLANKLRMLELPETHDFDALVALDCDVVVTGDMSPWIGGEGIAAKPADYDRFTDEEWQRLFALFGIGPQRRELTATATGEPVYPYFNSGVIVVPRGLSVPLRDAWTESFAVLREKLAADPSILREQWRWLAEQASLALGILARGLPWRALPAEMNYPSHVKVPADATDGPPVVIHYHAERADGFLLRSVNEVANDSLDRFNRSRAERLGVPYDGLRRRPLWQRARLAVRTRFWGALADRRWYRSEPVTRTRKRVKRLLAR